MPAILNPILFHLPLNGSLAGRDRAGTMTATGTGAVRYQPAPESRHNYSANGSAEFAAQFVSFFSGSGTCTITRVTTQATHGSASARFQLPGTTAYESCHSYVAAGTVLTGLIGKQVWMRCKWKGTGKIAGVGMQAFPSSYATAETAVYGANVIPPADWTDLVVGPVTVPVSPGDVRIYFGNDTRTDGSTAYDIYVDEVMLTTENPTGWTYFDTSNGARTNLCPNPQLTSNWGWLQSGPGSMVVTGGINASIPSELAAASGATKGGWAGITSSSAIDDTTHAFLGAYTPPNGMGRGQYGKTYTISAWVYTVYSNVKALLDLYAYDMVNAVGGGNYTGIGSPWVALTPLVPTRISATFTTTVPATHLIRPAVRFASTNVGGTFPQAWATCILLEESSSMGSYFDGTTAGASWLDPRTGQLGTAHNSPSVTSAVAWIEEAATNLIKNPSAETNDYWWDGWGPIGPPNRTNAYAKYGIWSYESTTSAVGHGHAPSGANAIAVAVSPSEVCTFSVWVHSPNGRVEIFQEANNSSNVPVGYSLSSQSTMKSEWEQLSITLTAPAATAYVRPAIRSVDGHTFTWRWDGAQFEKRPYATSYCDGSLGSGYAWTGAANNSTSLRANTDMNVSAPNRVKAINGAAVTRVYFAVNGSLSSGVNEMWGVGTYNTTFRLAHYQQNRVFICYSYKPAGAVEYAIEPAGSAALYTWLTEIAMWNTTNMYSGHLSGTLNTGARAGIPSTEDEFSGKIITFGNEGYPLNGYLGPVVFYNQTLTSARRAMIKTAIDSNGVIDLWTLFEEFDGVLSPMDAFDFESIEATAGGSATIDPPLEITAGGEITMAYLPIKRIGGMLRVVPQEPVDIVRFAEKDAD